MFCHQCGNKCDASHKFCASCGTQILSSSPSPSKENTQRATEEPTTNNLINHIPYLFRQYPLSQSACQGDANAQYQIARFYRTGAEGFTVDVNESCFWLHLAAKGDSPEANSMLGTLKILGQEVPKDEKRGMEMLLKAAEQGEMTAMSSLYTIYKNGIPGVQDADKKKAFEFLQKLADLEKLESCYLLACHYYEGIDTPKDERRAFELWKFAADNGHADSMKNVSKCYEEGLGTNVDDGLAKAYLLDAANNGDVEALYCLGCRLLDGTDGVNQSIELAKECLEKIADINPEAYIKYCRCLVLSLDQESKTEGLRMLKKRAEEGDAEAAFELSNMYGLGQGVPENFMDSLTYLQNAANNGHPLAHETLTKMNMSKEPGSTQYKYHEPAKKPSLFSRLRKKI